MTDVVRVIRQSQGTEDSISLKQQRNNTRELAEELGADSLDTIDLGNTSGFSLFYKDSDDNGRLDAQPEVQELISGLRAGKWNYLIAHDDTRIARDEYFSVIQHAALVGGCELRFVSDVPDDRLTFRIQRVVEAETKAKEIEKSKAAVEHRRERGYYHGTPPFGLEFDSEGEYLVKDMDEWPIIERVFELRERGLSYRNISDEIGTISKSGVGNIIRENRELYLTRLDANHPAVSSAD
ncbi:recombinase family protein [Halorubrum sp. FL23]|uniref:recombinase family protein n=1 Tax=Halorubrum sp. FL23 TaxID=3458704 RepID=UPI004033498D